MPDSAKDVSAYGHRVFVAVQDGGLFIFNVTGLPPEIAINYSAGRAGRFFTISGYGFPENTTGTVLVNGRPLGTVSVDAAGGLNGFQLHTSAQAEPGLYSVAVQVNPRAAASFEIDPNAPLRAAGSGPVIEVPPDIAPLTESEYLPIIGRAGIVPVSP